MVVQLQRLLNKETSKVEELQKEKQLIADELLLFKSDKGDTWIVTKFLEKTESTRKLMEEVHFKQVEEMKREKEESDEVHSIQIEKLKEERDEALSRVQAFEKTIQEIIGQRDNDLKEKEDRDELHLRHLEVMKEAHVRQVATIKKERDEALLQVQEFEKLVEDIQIQEDTLRDDINVYISTLTGKVEILENHKHLMEKVVEEWKEENHKLKEQIDVLETHDLTQK